MGTDASTVLWFWETRLSAQLLRKSKWRGRSRGPGRFDSSDGLEFPRCFILPVREPFLVVSVQQRGLSMNN